MLLFISQSICSQEEKDSIEAETKLDAVAVVAQRPLVKNEIDRVAYDVQRDEESRTLTVLDMLRKVPYVTVDAQDNIQVKGSSAFKIYKNGRYTPSINRNPKEVLKAMPATMVKRIEVITDPGAREDAEGVTAILNLVMMEGSRMDGLTGSVTGGYSSLNHPNVGTYLMTQKGKFAVSGNYGYGGMSKRETENRVSVIRDYNTTGRHRVGHSEGTGPGGVHYASIEASLEMDTLNLLSASVGGYFYKLNMQGDNTTGMMDAAGNRLYSYDSHYWMPDYLHHSWDGRIDYEHKTCRKGETLTLSYMLGLTRQHTDSETTYSNSMGEVPFNYLGMLESSRERFTEHTLQADWLRPLGKGHQLETGLKYIFRNNRSRNQECFYGIQDTVDTRFRHRTQVSALYADYIYRHNRWSARAGFRYELSVFKISDDSINRTSLNDFVPQASVKYQLTDRQSLKLGYITSITRPGIGYLNPAVSVSPLRWSYGNPHLHSARQQQVHLIYAFMGQRLTLNLAPAFHFCNNGISRMDKTIGDVVHTTYENMGSYRRLQMEFYLQWRPFDKTTLVVNGNIRNERYANDNLGLTLSRCSAFYYANLTQQLPWELRLTLSAYGQFGKRPNDVYTYLEGWHDYSFALQRSFLRDERLTVRLSANHCFSKWSDMKARTLNGDFVGTEESQNRGRSFMLSISYRFGGLKGSVKKTETTIENDDIVGGIKKN